jgi:hypothetical protein
MVNPQITNFFSVPNPIRKFEIRNISTIRSEDRTQNSSFKNSVAKFCMANQAKIRPQACLLKLNQRILNLYL